MWISGKFKLSLAAVQTYHWCTFCLAVHQSCCMDRACMCLDIKIYTNLVNDLLKFLATKHGFFFVTATSIIKPSGQWSCLETAWLWQISNFASPGKSLYYILDCRLGFFHLSRDVSNTSTSIFSQIGKFFIKFFICFLLLKGSQNNIDHYILLSVDQTTNLSVYCMS